MKPDPRSKYPFHAWKALFSRVVIRQPSHSPARCTMARRRSASAVKKRSRIGLPGAWLMIRVLQSTSSTSTRTTWFSPCIMSPACRSRALAASILWAALVPKKHFRKAVLFLCCTCSTCCRVPLRSTFFTTMPCKAGCRCNLSVSMDKLLMATLTFGQMRAVTKTLRPCYILEHLAFSTNIGSVRVIISFFWPPKMRNPGAISRTGVGRLDRY